MREIKYKAWDKQEKQMCEVTAIYFPLGSPSGKDLTIKNKDDEIEWRSISEVELLEYTRLKDKNGKDIFEGDLLKYKAKGWLDDEWKEYILPIKWCDENLCWGLEKQDGEYITNLTLTDDDKQFEIVGHIFE